jgi:ABC-type sulfate/molybdate transport systems ATPase subunit
MRRMHAELHTSFLVVTHDPRLAERCDRMLELVDGRTRTMSNAPAAWPACRSCWRPLSEGGGGSNTKGPLGP